MSVPLALAAPAALAGAAYINAKHSVFYDVNLFSSLAKSMFRMRRRDKNGRLNIFYILEEHAQNKKTADRTFLISEGKSWSFKETYETVMRYGNYLKTTFNLKPKEIVAVDHMNGANFIFLWFGLWSIGVRPAFINYNLTSKPLVHCVKVSTARILLVDPEVEENVTQEVRDELPEIQFVTFGPELTAAALAMEPVRQPDEDRVTEKGQEMAMLIYTSGTTGLPKPAVIGWFKIHSAMGHFGSWMGLKTSDIFYTSMPLYHSSAAMLGVCNILNIGATVAVGHKFSTKLFWQDVRAVNATVIQYVGETCRYLLAAPPQFDPVTGENLDKKNNVRIAFGNGLRPDIWDKFKERFDIDAIAEFYAATEGTSGAFNFSRNAFSQGAIGRHGTVGKLIMGRQTILVELDWETEAPWRDPKTGLCRQVTNGEPGELLYRLDPNNIGEKFTGYFNNPKASEGKIMRDVLVKGDAFFRTGDMVKWNDDGLTYFSDRIGDTFRWKSENVSTNEVSEALGVHPSVQEANVYGVELPNHDGRAGCVALILKNSEKASPALLEDLAHHAKAQLPKYAVPIFIRITQDMLMTGTNKQQKHVFRQQGVDPDKVPATDELYWLKGGIYVKFTQKDWEGVKGGVVKL